MSRTASNYNKIIQKLQELHKLYPTFNMGRHLSTALDEYGNFWGISDKELLFALEKYATTLELDENNIVSEEYLEDIVKDAKDLFNSKEEEEDEYGNV